MQGKSFPSFLAFLPQASSAHLACLSLGLSLRDTNALFVFLLSLGLTWEKGVGYFGIYNCSILEHKARHTNRACTLFTFFIPWANRRVGKRSLQPDFSSLLFHPSLVASLVKSYFLLPRIVPVMFLGCCKRTWLEWGKRRGKMGQKCIGTMGGGGQVCRENAAAGDESRQGVRDEGG